MAFEFQYSPSNTGSATSAGLQMVVNRRKNRIEDENLAKQNAFSEVMAKSIDPQTGEMNFQNAFIGLGQAGLGKEAMALRDAVLSGELKQAQTQRQMQPDLKLGEIGAGGESRQSVFYDPRTGKLTPVGQPYHRGALVNVDQRAEGAGYKKKAEEDAQLVSAMKQKSIAGTNMLGPITRMEQMNEAGIPEGPLANVEQGLGKLAVSLGAGDELKARTARGEQYFAAAADVIREKIKALGSGSAISNVDLLFTRQSVGDLTNTQAGRRLILKAMRQDLENIRTSSAAAEKHFYENQESPGSLRGFDPAQYSTVLPELGGQSNKPKRKVGDFVQTKKGKMVIMSVNPDGTYEATPAK